MSKCTCADFVGTLFLARDVAHSVHLNTRSFSKHSALNTFYDEVIDLADKFAEAYQGRHEKSDSALQNIIDEIVGLYLSTLYKLKFLA